MKYQVIKEFLHPDVAQRISSHIENAKSSEWKHYYKFGPSERPMYSDNTIRDEFLKQNIYKKLEESLLEGHFTYRLKRLVKCTDESCECAICYLRKEILSTPDFLQFIGGLAKIEGLQLVEDFASVYGHGDFLSIHPDPNFDVAFILNLSKDWKYEYGGCLTVFDKEDPVVILPEYNSLVLLYLGEDGVDHYISEVSNLAPEPRMAVSGWFSRPQNSS